MREANVKRTTKETDISVYLNIDGEGKTDIDTGIGFFDHMLNSLGVHSGFDLTVKVKGDLEVDAHHTVEDTGIVIGQALLKALEDKSGIKRYASSYIPMDEALAFCAIDISARPYLVFNAEFFGEKMGEMDTQLVEEFFRALAFNAKITLHLNCIYGKNDHHMCEALFKSCAHALKEACNITSGEILSTKGVL